MSRVSPHADEVIVEQLSGADVVALGQCLALDVTVFPWPSIRPFAAARGMQPVWIVRSRRDSAVTGFVAATVVGDLLEIAGIAVAPEKRGRGFGRALIRAAIEGARTRTCRAVALQVSTANRAALALYTAEGFRRMRKLPGFYRRLFGDGGDAWVMVLPLVAAVRDRR
jgi:ribosomal protein S18 acetylase RimI-like enzyme